MVSGDHRRPRHRPPPTSPPSSQSPTPSDIEVRPAKYPCISCVVAQIGYVVAQVAVHVQFTTPSGLCFAGVLISFRSYKFHIFCYRCRKKTRLEVDAEQRASCKAAGAS